MSVVANAVVDRLEVVQIDKTDGESIAVLFVGLPQRSFQPPLEQPPVRQSRRIRHKLSTPSVISR